MRTRAEKGRLCKERHAQPGILILPNPWDAGTAKLLQSLGFEALATTSLGMSNALGRPDGENVVSRAELLENCRVIAEATDLPVNADLENGYADDPKEAATILREAAEAGIVAGSIEDWDGEKIYDFNHAVERVAAGVEALQPLAVAFGARHEGEGHGQRARHLDSGGHALDGMIEVVDLLAAPILDRAADDADCRRVAQDGGGLLRIVGIAVLEVGIDRQVGRPGDHAAILEKLGTTHRALAVGAAERIGHA